MVPLRLSRPVKAKTAALIAHHLAIPSSALTASWRWTAAALWRSTRQSLLAEGGLFAKLARLQFVT